MAARAAVLVLAIALTVVTVAAVRFHSRPLTIQHVGTPTMPAVATARAVSPSAASPPSPIVSARPTVSAVPLLRSHRFALESGRLRGTVYFTYEELDTWDSPRGQLVVSGIVRGAAPGVHYRLAGGDCTGGSARV